ncbi:glutathione synthase [Gonapodya prolifera JEL478]|uniref:Glutathione synthetase n=1 Tax=Gonapodya prolifera (strain JEL478) TaxID=1344416 RepID=A0A139A1A3_GONPJ|nr:glutathione synthase [Gonapodya prolifera JEL478]|eukprot:KXS10133.1 glutathione synthase [Gonapodya prolifera JEL478]
MSTSAQDSSALSSTTSPVYPPPLPPAQLSTLKTHAIDWALAHGLCMRAIVPSKDGKLAPAIAESQSVHLPFALFPSPYPRALFERVADIQPIWNALVHRISRDHEFLCSVIDEVAPVDDYTGRVYEIYKQVHAEGRTLDVDLGLHRSDYMVHTDSNGAAKALYQVEINTISSSFSHLSTRVSELHRYLSRRLDFFNSPDLPSPDIRLDQLPHNTSSHSIPLGLARAHQLYSTEDRSTISGDHLQRSSRQHSKAVLMVCQPNERNAFDQRGIEHVLWDEYEVKLIRGTLQEVAAEAQLSGDDRRLIFRNHEISVVYYRAGYTPNDYPTPACWDARLLLERARAVKCPSAAYHLVGTKKMQQVLAAKGIVERFIPDPAQAAALRRHMTGLYPLDGSPESDAALQRVLAEPSEYVLKPQREGGGNNYYGAAIPPHLSSLSQAQRKAYILMDRIRPPTVKTVMVREGNVIETGCVSELGVFGVWVSQGGASGKDDGVVHLNKEGGYLLRTKSNDSDEGGVAAGFAVVDSVLLV